MRLFAWLRRVWSRLWAKPLPPAHSPLRGGCGVAGCPNRRPHSHVEALIKRLKEKS
jgi:hypothetical protein